MSKVLILDIPPLRWGKSGEASFIASLNNIMKALKRETNYYELMGISGAAFRMQMHEEWCPSSGDWYDRSIVTQHLGYQTKSYHVSDTNQKGISKTEAIKLMKKSLDSGLPVIGIDLMKIPEWGIICGYEGDVFYVRDYFDNNSEEYVPMQKFPWIFHILEETSERSKKELVKDQLLQVVKNFSIPILDKLYYNGRAGFELWIDKINNDEFHKDKYADHWHINGWLYDLLFDARHAAHMFLLNILDLFSGEQRDKLFEVREKYRLISEYICKEWIYFPLTSWVDKEKKRTYIPPYDPSDDPEPRWLSTVEWTPEMREKGKNVLIKILEMEEDAITSLKSSLTN